MDSSGAKMKWLREFNKEDGPFKFLRDKICYCKYCEKFFTVTQRSQLQQCAQSKSHEKTNKLKAKNRQCKLNQMICLLSATHFQGQPSLGGSPVRPSLLQISPGTSLRYQNFEIFWRRTSPFPYLQSTLKKCTLKATTKMSLHTFESLLRGHQCGLS